MDLLLAAMATAGVFYYAENRCAGVAALVEERGVPTVEAIPWMEKGDYTITPLDRPPEGQPVLQLLMAAGGGGPGDRRWLPYVGFDQLLHH